MAFPSNAWCVWGMVSALLWSEHGAWAGGGWQEMRLLAKAGPSHQGPCLVGHTKEHKVRKGGGGNLYFRKTLPGVEWRRVGGRGWRCM